MTETSFNGLTVLMQYPHESAWFYHPAPGVFHVTCARNRAFAVLFESVLRRWHSDIEPVAAQHRDNWQPPRERKSTNKAGKYTLIGSHMYRPPNTSIGTGNRSNHRSASAIDVNGHLHPYEATHKGTWYSGFSAAQTRALRKIASDFTDHKGRVILRLGIDFDKGKRDGMHVETAPGVTQSQVNGAAAKLEDFVGRSHTGPVWWKNAKGLDVLGVQIALTAKGFDTKGSDGKAGNDTDAAIRRFQQIAGLVVDGRWGPASDKALTNFVKPAPPKPQPPKPDPTPEPPVQPQTPDMSAFRISGPNAYATAADAATAQWPLGAGVVYLVARDAHSDQVAAGGFTDGPVLLFRGGDSPHLPSETRDAIAALAPSEIMGVGGAATDDILYQARKHAGLV